MSRLVYLDHASATPLDETVLQSMMPYFTDNFYNPAAVYLPARQAKADLTEAKKQIASHLGVTYSELIITSGGTEANNLAISGVMDKYPGKKILVSAIEHESVINPANKYDAEYLNVDKFGLVKTSELENIENDVVMVSVMLANNEVGAVQPLAKIAKKLQQIRHERRKGKIDLPLYFHTDACQAPLYLDINAHRLGVDLMTLNGGKIYGPKQTGVLFVSKNCQLKPQILGGGQQRGLRSGSESVAHVVGFAKSLDLAGKNRSLETARMIELQSYFIKGLKQIDKNILINGPIKHRLPANIHATFPNCDNERLLYQLEDVGIMASAGSACSASSQEPSHVLKAMAVADKDIHGSVRFSMGRQTKRSDISYTLENITKFLQ